MWWMGRALFRAQVSFNLKEFTLEKDPMNVMSVGKPSVSILVLLTTEESTTYIGSTTVRSVGRPSVRAQVSSSTRESREERGPVSPASAGRVGTPLTQSPREATQAAASPVQWRRGGEAFGNTVNSSSIRRLTACLSWSNPCYVQVFWITGQVPWSRWRPGNVFLPLNMFWNKDWPVV